jgi:hypothetical protein
MGVVKLSYSERVWADWKLGIRNRQATVTVRQTSKDRDLRLKNTDKGSERFRAALVFRAVRDLAGDDSGTKNTLGAVVVGSTPVCNKNRSRCPRSFCPPIPFSNR